MYEFLSQLPNSPIGWIGLTIAAIAGGAGAYVVYNRNKDGSDDRLIGILQKTVDELEKKVNKQDVDIQALTTKVADLKSTNDTLTKVLQGRDEATLAFQSKVLEAVALAHETNGTTKALEKSMGKLTDLISAHIVAIETQDTKHNKRQV